MKFLPLMFYLLVFEPDADSIKSALLITAVGFATFENVCYLISNGAEDLGFLLIRGFGTGAMHIVCAALVGAGMVYVWPRGALRAAGSCAPAGNGRGLPRRIQPARGLRRLGAVRRLRHAHGPARRGARLAMAPRRAAAGVTSAGLPAFLWGRPDFFRFFRPGVR